MDLTNLLDEVTGKLRDLKDPERLKWAKGYYPTDMEIIGVTVPNIRPIMKDLRKRFKKQTSEEVVEFAKFFSNSKIHEVQLIAFEVLGRYKQSLEILTPGDIEELGANIDNWVSVDSFSVLVMGPAWRLGKISDDFVGKWAESENRWRRRAAVVSTVALNQKSRGGTGDPVRTLKICSKVLGDKDVMVVKALSWALRELAKRDKDSVQDFIDRNKEQLRPKILREVRRKIETGKKNK